MKDVLCDKSKQNNYFALQNILNFFHKIARCICHTKQELHICSLQKVLDNIYTFQSSGCGSVDRAIAYNTRVQSLITLCYLHTVNCIEKPKIKKKIPRMALSSSKAYESNGLVPVCLVLAKFLQRAEVFCDF